MRISDLVWHRNAPSERIGFSSSYVLDPLIFSRTVHSIPATAAANSSTFGTKTNASRPLPARQCSGTVYFCSNRVRLRAFARWISSARDRWRACVFPLVVSETARVWERVKSKAWAAQAWLLGSCFCCGSPGRMDGGACCSSQTAQETTVCCM